VQWIVSQIGAREHYAVPRALHAAGSLERLYTDAWWRLPAFETQWPPFLAHAASRRHPMLPGDRVTAFTLATLRQRARKSFLGRTATVEGRYRYYVEEGRWFAHAVTARLSKLAIEPSSVAFFGYSSASLESLAYLRNRGHLAVVDQIDPARVEEAIVKEESERWPGWQSLPGEVPEFYYERLAEEWSTADVVVVNSEWSRKALVSQGVPAEKLVVIPLAFEGAEERGRGVDPAGRLVVLWVGSLILRKGIQYLMAAARLLRDVDVEFVLAGPIGISSQFVRGAPANMKFLGRVPRGRVWALYESAHVFALPTLSDGFALTQLEAMAHGLPVIATPNCGDVVTDGHDGLVVPPRDPERLAAAIERLSRERALLAEMSNHALETAKRFTLRGIAERLTTLTGAG
jgi:glycosyltransferase involved in cell wall biosynthesis